MDLRIRRTRKLLLDAFLSLLKTKRFEAITVEAISRQAMVNRATFYRHFEDKYGLVKASLKAELDQLSREFPPPPSDFTTVDAEQPPEAWVRLFEHLAERADLYRLVLGRGGVDELGRFIRGYLEALMVQRLSSVTTAVPRVPADLAVAYLSSAWLGVAVWWLDHQRPYSARQMASALLELTAHGPHHALGLR